MDITIKTSRTEHLPAAALAGVLILTTTPVQADGSPYKFERGFPTAETIQKAYDASDLRRAIEAYKFFYLMWIKTIPGQGWWSAFRIYGPQAPAFDGTWKLNDLELMK